MEIRKLNLDDGAGWNQQHGDVLAFVRRYGAGRIPPAAFRALMKLSPGELGFPGSSLLVARIQADDGSRIAGVSCVTDYGRGLCLVVVHPLYRGRGLGSRLLAEQLSILRQLSCLVACDQISSLQMCFRAGFYARRLVKIHGGKPQLLLENSLSRTASGGAAAHFNEEGDSLCLNPF
ncbi:GNAT family N-acetyltransferase [Paenibacillus macerans]|uniref:GNAT family N-acetyltransferase n=1 Tax=Paenibacillus macerans TaxID=44252 RepID=UPI00203D9BE0|nr:GNAT family N-acetyltransferase [Paenibacillus macerans]MCM3702990.1 GNAT family N-acetyltransferase [Paenibacillus macerans]